MGVRNVCTERPSSDRGIEMLAETVTLRPDPLERGADGPRHADPRPLRGRGGRPVPTTDADGRRQLVSERPLLLVQARDSLDVVPLVCLRELGSEIRQALPIGGLRLGIEDGASVAEGVGPQVPSGAICTVRAR
jgi:hypothetical protein